METEWEAFIHWYIDEQGPCLRDLGGAQATEVQGAYAVARQDPSYHLPLDRGEAPTEDQPRLEAVEREQSFAKESAIRPPL